MPLTGAEGAARRLRGAQCRRARRRRIRRATRPRHRSAESRTRECLARTRRPARLRRAERRRLASPRHDFRDSVRPRAVSRRTVRASSTAYGEPLRAAVRVHPGPPNHRRAACVESVDPRTPVAHAIHANRGAFALVHAGSRHVRVGVLADSGESWNVAEVERRPGVESLAFSAGLRLRSSGGSRRAWARRGAAPAASTRARPPAPSERSPRRSERPQA